MLTFVSFGDLTSRIMANLHRLNRDDYDCVVGVPRSGTLPASIIATMLQLPLGDVEGFARGHCADRSGRTISAHGRVLLIDDSVNHGTAMQRAVAQISLRAKRITRLAVVGPYREEALRHLDMHFGVVNGPRAFAWNTAKHRRLCRWGFDLDGVLCVDPTREENDDGPHYLDFIANAKPLFRPQRPIGHVVTCRLEKYRAPTEDWLRRQGIEFQSLTMMPYATKAERMAAGNRGGWKASILKTLPVEFFIESNPKQAQIIGRETGLPVWTFGS